MFSAKYISIITGVIGILIGVWLCRTFFPRTVPPAATAVVLQPEITKAKVAVVTLAYNRTFDSLTKVNTTLSASLSNTRASLTSVKTQSAALQKQVLALLDNSPFDAVPPDTCACDSLKKTVLAWSDASDHKDSLYEYALLQSDSIVNVKDAALQLTLTQKDFVSAELDSSLSKQIELIREDLYYQAQFRKQKKRTWVAAAAAAVIAALGVLLLHP